MIVNTARLRSRTAHARIDVARVAPAALLGGYGIFIMSLFARNVLSWYINPVYIGPTVLAAVVLIALSVFAATSRTAPTHSQEDASSCGDNCDCEGARPRIGAYALLAVPLVLGALFPPSSLAAFSANERGPQIAGLSMVHSSLPARHVSLGVDTRTFGMQDWVGALSADPNPRDYMNKPVVLSGIVVHSPASVPTGYIMVIRYLITCCIADARPVGLVVQDTSHGTLKDNQWVTVTGLMGAASYQGQHITVVRPHTIRVTKSGSPYIY